MKKYKEYIKFADLSDGKTTVYCFICEDAEFIGRGDSKQEAYNEYLEAKILG